MITAKKYLLNCILATIFGLLLIFSNSISASDVDNATWNTATQKTKRNAEICNKHVQSVERNSPHYAELSQCNRIYRQVLIAMKKSKTSPSSNLLGYAKQCDDIFNNLPAEYQNDSGIASEEKAIAPSASETTEDIIVEIENIAQQCEALHEKFKDPTQKIKVTKGLRCKENCLAISRKIRSGHIGPEQAGHFRDNCKAEMKQADQPLVRKK